MALIVGRVAAGMGYGLAYRDALGDLGYEPYPGTLNLEDHNVDRCALPSPTIVAHVGGRPKILLWSALIHVDGGVKGHLMRGWHPRAVEVVAVRRLRDHVADGDVVTLEV